MFTCSIQEKKKRRRRDNQPTKKVRGVQKKKFAAVDAEFVTGDMNRVTEAPEVSLPEHTGPPPQPPPSAAQGEPALVCPIVQHTQYIDTRTHAPM